jgi:hypothetical protein
VSRRVFGSNLTLLGREAPEILPNLPDGIVDLRYTLDISVCGPWEVAAEPQHPGPLDASPRSALRDSAPGRLARAPAGPLQDRSTGGSPGG